jgi:hypothetical protein
MRNKSGWNFANGLLRNDPDKLIELFSGIVYLWVKAMNPLAAVGVLITGR